jgi:hypothetical protein
MTRALDWVNHRAEFKTLVRVGLGFLAQAQKQSQWRSNKRFLLEIQEEHIYMNLVSDQIMSN